MPVILIPKIDDAIFCQQNRCWVLQIVELRAEHLPKPISYSIRFDCSEDNKLQLPQQRRTSPDATAQPLNAGQDKIDDRFIQINWLYPCPPDRGGHVGRQLVSDLSLQ
ncbi:hypothetical protein ACVIDN_002834 [Rhizobium brockwellii]